MKHTDINIETWAGLVGQRLLKEQEYSMLSGVLNIISHYGTDEAEEIYLEIILNEDRVLLKVLSY